MGPVDTVMAYAGNLAHERIEVEDTAVAALRFKSGAFGVIEGSTAAYPGFQKKVELCGWKGSVTLEEESLTVWNFAEGKPEDEAIRKKYAAGGISGGAADPAAISYQGHKKQFMDVIASIEAGKPPAVGGREARKAVEIILAVYKSAETGREVKLPL